MRAYGEMGIAYQGADAAARDAARLLQTVWDKGRQLTAEDRGELFGACRKRWVIDLWVALDHQPHLRVIGARGTPPVRIRPITGETSHPYPARPGLLQDREVGNYMLSRYPVPGFTS
ncbi:hypothetical protein IWGMT90018_59580 [Mycobacterium kiyosense]|nr:hypothetical protein IWGMT90018_59580 [Mycobacterium kiyosense]